MTIEAPLEDGYYWVKLEGEWVIGEYSRSWGAFMLCGNDSDFYVSELSELGPRVLPPGNSPSSGSETAPTETQRSGA